MTNEVITPEQDIRDEDFTVLFPRNYAQYMAATIVDRAIPDARDGLKPVQRRILYCMFANGYRSNRPTIKSAKIVGPGDRRLPSPRGRRRLHDHGPHGPGLHAALSACGRAGQHGLDRQRPARRLPVHRGAAVPSRGGAAGGRGPGDGPAGAHLPAELEGRRAVLPHRATCRRS